MATKRDNFEEIEGWDNKNLVGEPSVAYQQTSIGIKELQAITQHEIDAECLSLEESKRRILNKINHYYHQR